MAKIGIMGGTFDPIHYGHLMLGTQAYEEYELDEVWYMPSGRPPHKRDHPVTPAADRCEMTRLAINGHPGFRLSDIEVKRNGTTYTAQTLELLHNRFPDHRFYFIVGADSLFEIESWYHPERVLALAHLLVAGRAYDREFRSMDSQIRYLQDNYDARIDPLHCSRMELSSEDLRRKAASGESLAGSVPQQVARYIREHGLYQ